MRRYPVITVAVAVLVGLAASELSGYVPVATCALLLAGAFLFPRSGPFGHLLYAVVLVAVLYGQFRYWHVPPDDLAHLAGQRLTLTATVAELPAREAHRDVFRARARTVTVDGRTVPVSGLVRVSRYRRPGAARLAYGDTFTARATLRPVTSLANPGGFDYAAYLWRQGVRVRATVSSRAAVAVRPAPPGFLTAVNRWRERMRAASAEALPPAPAGLLTALAAGDARAVPQAVRERFQAAGLAHLLAVSGTHLGLVAGAAFVLLLGIGPRLLPARWLVRLTSRVSTRQAAGLGALVAVTGYALLAGARTPTLRALVMVWMVMLALLLGRRGHAPTALAVAALALLAWDPRAVGLASFQLSFAAVLAILLVLARLPRPQAPPTLPGRLRSRALATGAVTLAAGLATLPLAAWHFGQVAPWGFAANFLMVPLAGVVVLPVAVGAAALAPLFGGLPAAGAVGWVLAAFLKAVAWFADLPGALAWVAAPPLALVAGTYAAGLLLWCGWHHLGRRGVLTGAAVLLPAWLLCLHPPPPTGSLRVALLDVGQGDAAVVVGPTGEALVIDGGTRFGRFDTGRLAVAPYLRALGVRTVSLLASHPQADHAGGLVHLVSAVDPRAVYTNGTRRPDTLFDTDFHAALDAAGITPRVLHRGSPFAPLAGVRARVLSPAGPGPPRDVAPNDGSLVVRLGYGRHTFLFAADIEAGAERALVASGQDLSATVLKVPHHGAATSSTAPFLARVAPRLAVISAGRDNPFHHPSPGVVAAYRARHVPLYRTASDGAVLLESDGATLRAATWRGLAPARIAPWGPDPRGEEVRNVLRLLRPERLWRTVA
jgi:competence protein ComEC